METRLDTVLDEKGRHVHSVPPDATVLEAVRVMNEFRVGAVLVVQERQLVGIFTERDILTRVLHPARDVHATKVGEVMTRRVVVVEPQITVDEAMAVMTKRRCRHLPVMQGDELLGMVSIGDLIQWRVRDKNFLIDQLHKFVTGQYPA